MLRMRQKAQAASRFAQVKFLKRKRPIAVRWQLLNACDAECVFCHLHTLPAGLVPLDFILPRLEQVVEIGGIHLSLSGGEPLIRDDIGTIVRKAKALGLQVSMNTTGTFIEKRIDDLHRIDLLKVSVHGPREIHARVEGGVDRFEKTMAGLEAAYREKIPFALACTVTKYNVEHLDFVVDLAAKYDTVVAIQTMKEMRHGAERIHEHTPNRETFVAAIDRLIDMKRRGNKHLRNTMVNLRHIRQWPNYPPLPCKAGSLFVIIEPNGDFMPCDRIGYDHPLPNLHHMTMREALRRTRTDFSCAGCGFCGALEINYAHQLSTQAFVAISEIVRRGPGGNGTSPGA
ncbi:radical SAM protein [bacterium]|nr:radical SAM protein [bacterium]